MKHSGKQNTLLLLETSLTAEALPDAPSKEKLPKPLVDLVEQWSELFLVVTPIDVDDFQCLLWNHPNCPFVVSVLCSLWHGFWPATEIPVDYPTILNLHKDTVTDEDQMNFYMEQCKKEFALGRFSKPFGKRLELGMVCMPVFIIFWNGKYRMIMDHSFGPYSLNLLISKDKRSFPLSLMQSFGHILCQAKQNANGCCIIIFKSDVSQAYCCIPMHPLWQPLQATHLPDGQYCINHNNVFGGATSGHCWWMVSALVLWIAEHVYGIQDLCDYVDDIFGWDYADNILFYERYGKLMPAHQVWLLWLWDELGIPHEEAKQVSGFSLPIIGFQVNVDQMSITMPPDAQQNLKLAVLCFISGCRPACTLCQCQRLAGYINWSLNVTPHLQLGLASLYAKMHAPPGTRYNANKVLHINEDIMHKLHWLLNHFCHSNGLFFFQTIAWHPLEADITIYIDTSLSGIGMWSPDLCVGFYCDIKTHTPTSKNFYYEAYIVMCALCWATHLSTIPQQLVVFSNNSNTVDIFNSMKAHGQFNDLLKYKVDMIMTYNIDIWVIHIARADNTIADHLSHGCLESVHDIDESLLLHLYQPLMDILGAGVLWVPNDLAPSIMPPQLGCKIL